MAFLTMALSYTSFYLFFLHVLYQFDLVSFIRELGSNLGLSVMGGGIYEASDEHKEMSAAAHLPGNSC